MKLIPYQFVKKSVLSACRQQLERYRTDIDAATAFVKKIEQGDLEATYENGENTNHSPLAQSLLSMRNQMKQISLEEKQRNWVSEGLAKFVDILRSKNESIDVLGDDIIKHLVSYMEANQGALYLLNDESENDLHLELIACYAYNRKKHRQQRIEIGTGITGQVVLEKTTTYMTAIPDDYLKITSGLGAALPRNLLIVPLKIEDQVFGVIEIASFKILEDYKIGFVEKLGESIASAIRSVKVNSKTRLLLQETQQQAEEMRATEEEMRQNMEELSATQEEMQRAQKRTEEALTLVRDKEMYLNNMLNATSDAILTVDRNMNVVMANKVMIKTFRAQGIMMDVGFPVAKLAKPGEEKSFLEPYTRAFEGETVELERSYFDRHYLITYNPLRNDNNEINGVSLFTKDITEARNLQLQTEALLEREKHAAAEGTRNREALTRLTKSRNIQNGNLAEGFEEITSTLTNVFGITRAAVWSYRKERESIQLEKLHQADESNFVTGGELFKKDIPTYFASVENEEVILAKDTFEHPSLVEFKAGYLDTFDIQSMLDVPYFIDGELGGVICCEHQKAQKDWTSADVEFAQSMADIISLLHKSAMAKKLFSELKAQNGSPQAHVSVNGH